MECGKGLWLRKLTSVLFRKGREQTGLSVRLERMDCLDFLRSLADASVDIIVTDPAYSKSGTVCGIRLPAGLIEAQQLPEPIFTPTTKAETGHDEPLTFEQVEAMVGRPLAAQLRDATLAVYSAAAEQARERGIIIADTKLEFGIVKDNGSAEGRLILIDELLTPDSSRFWDTETYQPGSNPPSYDKQYVRDYLSATGWNKAPPAPPLPPEVVARTQEKYADALRRLTGREVA